MGIYDLIFGGVQARIMKMQAILGSRPNTTNITENIWVGGENDPKLVVSQRFGVVLDLRENNDPKYADFLKKQGAEYVNFRIPDRYGATPEVLSQIVALICTKVSEGQKILIHCNLGRGRSALAVAAYLVSRGYPPEYAINIIKEKRSVTYLNERQKRALYDFKNALASSPKKFT